MLTWTSSNLAPHPLESRSSARRPRNMPVKRSLGPKSSESFHAGWEPGTAVQAPSGARKEKRIWSSFRSHRSSMGRSEEHTSELQSRGHLVCRLLLEKKKKMISYMNSRDQVRMHVTTK